jgi:hypothetical protein
MGYDFLNDQGDTYNLGFSAYSSVLKLARLGGYRPPRFYGWESRMPAEEVAALADALERMLTEIQDLSAEGGPVFPADWGSYDPMTQRFLVDWSFFMPVLTGMIAFCRCGGFEIF